MINSYYQHQRQEVMALVHQVPKRLLDVGCGEGRFAAQLAQLHGSEAWGIEMDAAAAAVASTHLHQVLKGSFEAVGANLPRHYFDAVFFNDVLEHMVDPWQTLHEIKSVLAPGAKVYASIPNFLFVENILLLLKTKDWIYTDSGILDRTHMRFFTRKSMVRMFEDCGYEVTNCHPLNVIDSLKWRCMHLFTGGYTRDFMPLQYGIVAQLCR